MNATMRFLSPYSTSTWVLISVLMLVLIGSNTYVSRVTVSGLTELQQEISRKSDTAGLFEDMHISLLTAESGQRGFLLTDDERYLKHYQEAVKNIRELLLAIQKSKSHRITELDAIAKLEELIEKKVRELDLTLVEAKRDNIASAIRIVETDEGRILYNEIYHLFKQIKLADNLISINQVVKLQKTTDESIRNLTISFITSLILLIGVMTLARANVKNQLVRQQDMETQNEKLKLAVEERTLELSLFSDELSRSNRELEDFAFVASHDLQEPLRKIMAFGDRLETQSENLTEKQRDFLQRMRSAASRMSTLISDLLEFSRISTRGKTFQTVDLNTIVQNCIEDLNVLIEETNVAIDIKDLPTIVADPTQMQQLLFNLIANAIKFSKNEAIPSVSIDIDFVDQPESITIEGLDDWIRIRVTDNGIGFEQEYAAKIFAPFQRLHSRENYKGTGIGLAICRRIVERHNGIIEAQSETDKGAVFSVTLPATNHLISIKQ